MVDIKRRSFISGAAAATVSSLIGGGIFANKAKASIPNVPFTEEEHRVIIIGSGFGGGVAALRLAQAGIPVTVLERGKWWTAGPNIKTFPSFSQPDDRLEKALWYGTANVRGAYTAVTQIPGLLGLPVNAPLYAGLLDAVVNPNLTVVTAAGVGGGSLVYQGMTLQPTEALFNRVMPSGIDYQEMDDIYYPRVAQMLQIATAPDELIYSTNYRAARTFKQNALNAGYGVDKIPMPIDWSFALRELNGEMTPSYTNGDCALGVNNGGKHSVDVTYLQQAMATGLVTVEALHNVTNVARAGDGRWQILVDRTDEHGKLLEQKLITSKGLIMAAGSVNTTKLLLRASHLGLIPDMPDGLGEGWGTNGDRILTWTSPLTPFGNNQGGPVIYGSKEWNDPNIANTVIQASLPPTGLDIRTTMMVGFGISDARGRWTYDPITNDSHLNWSREADAVLHQRILKRAWKIAGPLSVIGDTHAAAPMTWHPLGGANMGTVCDLEGRVQGHPGLYVLDGALIPGSTAACNPSMTIAAIAERAIDDIVANDIGVYI
jgi:cholesterol oxidase